MSIPKRIHIVGSTGSGKTYLAEKLSRQFNLYYGELDTVMWSGPTELAGKNSPEKRDQLLHDIIDRECWIVEGVYYKWLASSFERAEQIIFLDIPVFRRDARIVLRFIRQKLKMERAVYKQTLTGLLKMLKWNHEFENQYKQDILMFLKPYEKKMIILKKSAEIQNLIEDGRFITTEAR